MYLTTKKKLNVYLKFEFNWTSCLLFLLNLVVLLGVAWELHVRRVHSQVPQLVYNHPLRISQELQLDGIEGCDNNCFQITVIQSIKFPESSKDVKDMFVAAMLVSK